MKKFTLMIVAVMMATMAFAQKADFRAPAGTLMPNAGKVAAPRALPAGKMKAPAKAREDYVIIDEQPEGELVTYNRTGGYYYVSNSKIYYSEVATTADVVFAEDNKVYIKDIVTGLAAGTWVEGTLNAAGDEITVPLNQNVYYSSSYDACVAICWIVYNSGFSVDENVTEAVFSVDNNRKEITLQGAGFTDQSLGAWWTDDQSIQDYGDYEINLSLAEDVAAIPATPSIDDFSEDYNGYGPLVYFTVPAVDVEDNPLVLSKLSYRIMKEEGGVVSTYVLSADNFENLDEDMDEIPFGFTDDYDIYSNAMFLNTDVSTWTKIGIQSIYRGGDEENLSEISWYVLTLPVVAPDGLVTEEYSLTATQEDSESSEAYSGSANVGFDGTDVYFQGFCIYLPEAWVKGTLEGGIVTVPAGQYFGTFSYSGYDFKMFLNPDEDLQFAYDDVNGTFTALNPIVVADEEGVGYYAFNDAVLGKVADVAAVPATPTISGAAHSDAYGYHLYFDIPLVDTEGNAILSSKLYWRLASDEGGVITVPVTLSASDYMLLEDDMEEVPYGFTDDWDIYENSIWLNMAEAYDWDRVGVQVVYYGGDEENVSDIAWYTLKEHKTVQLDQNGYATFCDGYRHYVVDTEGAVAYTGVVDLGASRVVFTELEAGIFAGDGVLIKGEPSGEVELVSTPFKPSSNQNDFIAAIEDVEDFAPSTFVLGVVNGQSGFYRFAGNVIPAGKAYLDIPALLDPTAKLSLVFDGAEATGIETVETPVKSDNRVFNLNGQRVNRAQKGVYIVNGKKVVIK